MRKSIFISSRKAVFNLAADRRNKESGMPRLIFPSLQVNMRAGHFPEPVTDDDVYLKVPVTGLKNK